MTLTLAGGSEERGDGRLELRVRFLRAVPGGLTVVVEVVVDVALWYLASTNGAADGTLESGCGVPLALEVPTTLLSPCRQLL